MAYLQVQVTNFVDSSLFSAHVYPAAHGDGVTKHGAETNQIFRFFTLLDMKNTQGQIQLVGLLN